MAAKKGDIQLWGLAAGLVLPAVFAYLVYWFRFDHSTAFTEVLEALKGVKSLGKLLSLSVMPNLLLFFIGIWSERLLLARGVLTATAVYAVAAVVLFLIR
ncbi:MAG TPA: hypothetical protein GXZ39_04985 [Bacteroidales bacterium]|nr:hypothetical protein [Bacteroidales bacterium]